MADIATAMADIATAMADRVATPLLVPSARCTIVGLNGRADLNGQACTLLTLSGERWAVRVDGSGEGVRVKPANLSLIKEALPFEATTFEIRGRGLRATRDIGAGEVLVRERPTALCFGDDVEGDGADEARDEILSQLFIAAAKPGPTATAISKLCAFVEQHDKFTLDEVAAAATPAVRARVAKRAGADVANGVTPSAVAHTYCQYSLNAMAVLGPASLDTIGTGVYALHGALCNSELEPNCWCCFELVAAAGDEPAAAVRSAGPGGDPKSMVTCAMVLRSLVDIQKGDEITIAYQDAAQPLPLLKRKNLTRYRIPTSATIRSGSRGAVPSGNSALAEVEALGEKVSGGRSFMREHQLLPPLDGVEESAEAKMISAAAKALEAISIGGDASQLEALKDQVGGMQAMKALERISLAHAELGGCIGDTKMDDTVFTGPPNEPAAIVPSVTRWLEAALAKKDWVVVHAACEMLLRLYSYCYPPTYPQTALRMKLAGQAALKRSPPDYDAASSRLRDAARMLRVTHGADHAVTEEAERMYGSCRKKGK